MDTPSTAATVASPQGAEGHIIWPFREPDSGPPIVFTSAAGLRLRDSVGREFLDGMAGLYNVHLGYGNIELATAAYEELTKLGYGSLFFGLAHDPALRLAAKLATLTPGSLNYFLFTLSGSDAIDSAIKLARHHFAHRGQPQKSKIIARHHSYHGMTLASLSATGVSSYWKDFGPLVPGFSHVRQPRDFHDDAAAEELERRIRIEGPDTVAAFIAEPISMPGRMITPPESYWPRVRAICSKYSVLLIADEVVTGFGRSGQWFALDHWNTVPDMLVMSKGITSGYFPLAAVAVSPDVADTLADGKMLPHGFTSGGHPAGCAVALKTIEIIERDGLLGRARALGEDLRSQLSQLARQRRWITNIRGLGLMAAFDLDARRDIQSEHSGSAGLAVGGLVRDAARRNGMLLRNYDNTVVLLPPLTATDDDVTDLVSRLEGVLNECACIVESKR